MMLMKYNPLNSYHMGVDIAEPGGDKSVYVIMATPTRLRKFLRRIKLDRSTWSTSMVSSHEMPGEMKVPSSNWRANLVQVIQECRAETGMSFGEYQEHIFSGLPRDTADYTLVQIVKGIT